MSKQPIGFDAEYTDGGHAVEAVVSDWGFVRLRLCSRQVVAESLEEIERLEGFLIETLAAVRRAKNHGKKRGRE